MLPFVLWQSCHRCVSEALRIASEITAVGYCNGTACFLSRCVVVPGEQLVHALFAFSARGKEERFLLRLVKTLQPLRAAFVSKNTFKVSLWAFTSLNFLISVTESCKC